MNRRFYTVSMLSALLLTAGLLASPHAGAQAPWGSQTTGASAPPPPPPPTPAAPATPWGTSPAAPAPVSSSTTVTTPAVLAQSELADPGDAHLAATVVVRVTDRDAAATQMIAATQAAGGWFAQLSADSVSLKVPRAQLRPLAAYADTLGDVADRGFSREDLTARLGDLRAQLASRDAVLDQYMAVLATASPKAVVSVEREVTRLVSEIEALKGQILGLEHRSTYADLTVSFRFRDRQAPVRDGLSSFAWINTLNVADLMEDLQDGRRARRSAATAVAPEGFAQYRGGWRFQAISPEGVGFRVRSERHKPQASLDFWREALRERMESAGYTLVSEQDVVAADGSPGVLFDMGAANGPKDLTYLVAIFDGGGRLVVVEAAGESDKMLPRRAAVSAAIGALAL